MKSLKNKSEAEQRKIRAFRAETRKQHTPEGGVPWGDHAATYTMPINCRKVARQMLPSTQEFMVRHCAGRRSVADRVEW